MRFLSLLFVAGAAMAQQHDAQVEKLARSIEAKVIAQRREFAMHPELSNRETKTAQIVATRLKELGFTDIKTGVAKTGVVALLKGGKPGPVVAWRADMDGLPIQDIINKPYKSQNAGVKHACGHDSHVAVALGIAEVLSQMKAEIPGTVKFIFQPAEEGAPKGEEGGAALMVKEGVLKNPDVKAIFGMHVMSVEPSGTIAYAEGPLLAASDSFDLIIKGKGVHASTPQLGNDPIFIAASCIQALQGIRSRRLDPREPMVLSFGAINGGNRENIIPDEVAMKGTIRTLSEQTREDVKTMMRQTLAGCTGMYGASYELSWRENNYPVTVNDPALTSTNLEALRRVLGTSNVKAVKPILGGEDFSFYQHEIPGFFWFLGVKNEAKGITAPHHTAAFDLDEAALVNGVRAGALQLLDYLEHAK